VTFLAVVLRWLLKSDEAADVLRHIVLPRGAVHPFQGDQGCNHSINAKLRKRCRKQLTLIILYQPVVKSLQWLLDFPTVVLSLWYNWMAGIAKSVSSNYAYNYRGTGHGLAPVPHFLEFSYAKNQLRCLSPNSGAPLARCGVLLNHVKRSCLMEGPKTVQTALASADNHTAIMHVSCFSAFADAHWEFLCINLE
jgi:hypothetical protein